MVSRIVVDRRLELSFGNAAPRNEVTVEVGSKMSEDNVHQRKGNARAHSKKEGEEEEYMLLWRAERHDTPVVAYRRCLLLLVLAILGYFRGGGISNSGRLFGRSEFHVG